MASDRPPAPKRRGHGWVAGACALFVVAMGGLAYAAVPFYHAFCQVTGFDGTARRVERAPTTVINRKITVRFDANVRGLPWELRPGPARPDHQARRAGAGLFSR